MLVARSGKVGSAVLADRMLVIIFRFLALDAKLYACLDNIIASTAPTVAN